MTFGALRRAAGQHLIHCRFAALTGVEHDSDLHERGLDVGLPLAGHPVEVDRRLRVGSDLNNLSFPW
jgi:hypothetical protein